MVDRLPPRSTFLFKKIESKYSKDLIGRFQTFRDEIFWALPPFEFELVTMLTVRYLTNHTGLREVVKLLKIIYMIYFSSNDIQTNLFRNIKSLLSGLRCVNYKENGGNLFNYLASKLLCWNIQWRKMFTSTASPRRTLRRASLTPRRLVVFVFCMFARTENCSLQWISKCQKNNKKY